MPVSTLSYHIGDGRFEFFDDAPAVFLLRPRQEVPCSCSCLGGGVECASPPGRLKPVREGTVGRKTFPAEGRDERDRLRWRKVLAGCICAVNAGRGGITVAHAVKLCLRPHLRLPWHLVRAAVLCRRQVRVPAQFKRHTRKLFSRMNRVW